jgi:hypothetical protein
MRIRSAVVAVAATFSSAALADAQGSSISVDGSVYLLSGWKCVNTPTYQVAATPPITQHIASCAEAGVTGTSFSSATYTTLRASSSLVGDGSGPGGQGTIAIAEAHTHETLTFIGIMPASVVFYVSLDGSQSGSVSRVDDRAESYGRLDATWVSGGKVSSAFYESYPKYPEVPGRDPESQSANWVGTAQLGRIEFPVFGAVNTFDLSLFSSVYLGDLFGPASPLGSVVSDYSHTAQILAIQMFDAQDRDVTRTADFTFASGTRYTLGAPGTPTTTPEPLTWTLLGTGLLTIWGSATWRRHRTQRSGAPRSPRWVRV